MSASLSKQKNLIPISEAAEVLGVSIDTVRRWDKKGILHSERADGKNRYFSLDELEKVKFAQPLPISEASKRLKISPSTLRRLENRGLVTPKRNEAGERVYDQDSLEKFLNSEYFLRQKAVEEKVLGPLKEPFDSAQGKVENSEETPIIETKHKILGAEQEVIRKEVSKLVLFKKIAYGSGLFLFGSFTLITALSTAAFLLFPEQSAQFLGYNGKQNLARTDNSLVTSSDQVLGVGAEQGTVWGSIFKPFTGVSLEIVKQVDPVTYKKIVPTPPIEDVNELFTVDEEGNITPKSSIKLPDSSFLQIGSQEVVKEIQTLVEQQVTTPVTQILGITDIKSDSARLKVTTDSDVATLSLDLSDVLTTVSKDYIKTEQIKDGEVKEADLADGAVTSSKISDGTVVSGDLATNSVTSAKISDDSITATDLASTLTFASGDYLDLSAVTHGSTSVQGLRLPSATSATPSSPSSGEGYLAYDTSGNQLIVYNGSAWTTVTGGSGSAITVEEGDSTVDATVTNFDFLGADFIVGETPEDEVNISIDYTNSKIVRSDQTESITGGWTFANLSISDTNIPLTGSSLTFDFNNASDRTLTIANSGDGTANFAVDGTISQGGSTLAATYAPISADFITVAANGTLTGETAIGSLTTGISTTSTLNADGATTLAGVTLDANANLTLSSGTGSVVVTNAVTNASDEVIDITPSFTGGATDTLVYSVIDIAGFTADNGAGTDTVTGFSLGNLTESGAGAISSRGVVLGSGWDVNLLLNDTSSFVQVADGGNITIEDSAGNDILVLADTGGSSAHTLTGDADTGFTLSGITTLTASSLTTLTTGALSINPGGTLTLGDNGDAFVINGSDFDVSGGDITGDTDETINGIDINAGAVSDISDLALLLGAANDFTIDATTTPNTQTSGVIDLNVATVTANNIGLNVDYTINDSAGISGYGGTITTTVASDAGHDSTGYALRLLTDSDDVGSTVYGLYIDADNDSGGEGTEIAIETRDGVVRFGDGTDYAQFSTVGDVTFVDANDGASITGPAGGALTVASANSQGLTVDSASGRVTVATGDFLSTSVSGVSGAAAGDVWYDSAASKYKINEGGVTKTLCNTTDAACGAGSGSAWSALTVPTTNLQLAMDADTTTFDWISTGALAAWTQTLSNTSSSATTQSLMVLKNAQVDSANDDNNTENLLLLQQLDTATGDSNIVDNAIKIDVAGAAAMTNGIEITNSAGNLTNGINLVDTTGGTFTAGILMAGTFTSLIDAPNFDVNNAGNITVAANEGIDTNAAGLLEVGITNANAITIGSSGITTTNAGAFTATGTLTANGAVNLGDGGDAIAISGTTVSITSNTGSNDITLTSADDFIFNPTDDITTTLAAGGQLVLDGSTNANTTTDGILKVSGASVTNNNVGLNVAYTSSNGVTAGEDLFGGKITVTQADANGDLFGLQVISANSTLASSSTDDLLTLRSADTDSSDGGLVDNGLNVTSAGGIITNGINFDNGDFTSEIVLENGETITNQSDEVITIDSTTFTLNGTTTITASSLTTLTTGASDLTIGTGDVNFTATGGSSGNADVDIDGYLQVGGTAELDGALQADGAATFNSTVTANTDVDFTFIGATEEFDVASTTTDTSGSDFDVSTFLKTSVVTDGSTDTHAGAVIHGSLVNTESSGVITDTTNLVELTATANDGWTGYYILAENASGTDRFTVDALGNVIAAGSITEAGTSLAAKYAPIAANFVTVTANGTLTGETGIDALSTAISTSSTLNVDGASTLAGTTIDANADLTLASGTGSLVVTNSVSNASDQVIDIAPAFAGGATDSLVYTVIDIAAFTPTNAAGTDTIEGLAIRALTQGADASRLTANAITIGDGWDLGITGATYTIEGTTALTLGTSTGTIAINSSDWDIDATGIATGLGAITSNGLITTTAGLTVTGAAVSLNASSNFDVNIATGTSTGDITLGGGTSGQLISINSDDWDISTSGDLTGIGGITSDGAISATSTLNVDSTSTLAAVTLDANADFTMTAGTGTFTINSTVAGTDNGQAVVLTLTGDTGNDADTATGINILATNSATDQVTDDNIYGVYIQNLGGTALAGNEYAIYQAGTSWDYGIYAEDLVGIDNDLTFIGAQSITTTTGNLTINTAGTLVVSDTLQQDGTLAANGQVDLGDGGDAIAISGTTVSITSNTGSNDITLTSADDITTTLTAGGQLVIDGSTTANTTTDGILKISGASTTNNNVGLNIAYTSNNGVTSGEDLFGAKITVTQADANGDLFGLQVISANSTLASSSTDDLLTLHTADTDSSDGGLVDNGLKITSAGGAITTGLNLADTDIVTAIVFQHGETLNNTSDEVLAIDSTTFTLTGTTTITASSLTTLTTGALSINPGGTLTLGDNGDAFVINGSDFDVSGGDITADTDETINGIDINAGAVSDVVDLALVLGASNDITIDSTTTPNTQTSGVIDLNVSTVTTNNVGLNIDYTINDSAGISGYGATITAVVADDTAHDSTAYGLRILGDIDDLTGTSTVYGLYIDADNDGGGHGTEIAIETRDGLVRFGDGTDYAEFGTAGDITFVDANSGSSITGPEGGALSIIGGGNDAITITANAASTWSSTAGGLTIHANANATILTLGGGDNLPTAVADGNDVEIRAEDDAFITTTDDILVDATGGIVTIDGGEGVDAAIALQATADNGGVHITAGDAEVAAIGTNESIELRATADTIVGLTAAGSLVIDGATTLSTNTDGALDINVTTLTTGVMAANITLATDDSDGAADTVYGMVINIDDNSTTTAEDTTYGLYIDSLSNGTTDPDQVAEALLVLDNSDATAADAVDDGILFVSAGGAITDAIDASATEIGTALRVAANAIEATELDFNIAPTGSTSSISVASSADAEDFTIELTGANNASLFLTSAGTGADAMAFTTTAGGLDISVTGDAAGEDLDITTVGAATEMRFSSGSGEDDAMVLSATADTGGIHILAGDGEVAAVGTDESIELRATADTIVALTAGGSLVIDGRTTASTNADGALDVNVTTLTTGVEAAVFDLDVNGDTGDDADTMAGVRVIAANNATDATTDDNIYGITVENLAGSAKDGNEYAIYQAGTSWDYGLYIEDTAGFDADLTFIGAQTISTTTGNLTINTAGTLVVSDTLQQDGTLDANGQVDLGDGGDAITISGSDTNIVVADGAVVNIDGDGTPTADLVNIGAGDTSATDNVDVLFITSNVGAVSGSAIHIDADWSDNGDGNDTYNIFEVDAFTAVIDDTGNTNTLNGLVFGNLTQTETNGTITASALNIGTGWDTDINATTSLDIAIGGTAELALSATNLNPGADGGNSLGTSGTEWQDLFLNTGGVINFEAGDVTLTHSSNTITLAGGNLAIGTNTLSGSTAVVDFTDFDVSADGLVVLAPDSGLDADLNYLDIQTPAITATAATTIDVYGISSAGALNTTADANAEALTYRAISLTLPNMNTGEAGDSTVVTGLLLTPGTITNGSGTETVTGVDIGNITGGSGTDTAINIGTGWDVDLNFSDTTPVVRVADGTSSTITIEDSAGNDILVLADTGGSSAHTLTGDADTGFTLSGITTLTASSLTTLTTGALSINPGGTLTLGDNGDAFVINGSDFDVSGGDITGDTDETINGIDINAGAVSDISDLALLLGAANDFTIDATTTPNTQTSGVIDLNIDAGNAAVDGINIDLEAAGAITAATDITAIEILLTATDTDADLFGITLTTHATAGIAGSYEAGIKIDNADDTAASMTDAILITSSGVASGIADAIDVSADNIDVALRVNANSIIGTTGIIDYTGFDVDASGNLDALGALTAGSSNIAVTDSTGHVQHDSLVDCADEQILKWQSGGGEWGCEADATGAGSSKWTADAGGFSYLTDTDDDLVLGASTVAAASFYFDESAGTLYLGTNEALNGALTFYSSGTGETDPTIAANATGDLTLSAATGTVIVGSGTGNITLEPGTDDVIATLGATSTITIDATATVNTQVTGVLDLNVTTITDTASAMRIDLANNDTDGAADTLYGMIISIDDNATTTAEDTVYGLYIDSLDNGAADADQVAEAGIVIDNSDATAADALTDGILFVSAGGAITDAIDASATEIGTALRVAANAIEATELDFNVAPTGSTSSITVTTDNAAEDFFLDLAGATDSSLILRSAGTGADAMQITTTAGGLDISVTGDAAGEDLDLTTVGAATEMRLTSASTEDDAMVFSASADTGGIHILAGDGEVAAVGTDESIELRATADTIVALTAAGSLVIDGDTTNSTNTDGALDINVGTQQDGAMAVNLTIATDDGDAGSDTVYGMVINVDDNATDSNDTVYGLYIDSLSNGVTDTDQVASALLALDNSDADDVIADGILFVSAGGGFTDFIDTPSSVFKVSGTGDLTITGGDITGANSEAIDIGETDNGSIIFTTAGETNNESLEFDFETTADEVGILSSTGVNHIDFGAMAITVGSCTGCGGGGSTLQTAYDAGNTITTDATGDITITLAELGTPTRFEIFNNDTAGVEALEIDNTIGSGTLTNGLLIEESGAGTMTNAINIAGTAGTIDNGILIADGSGAITDGMEFTGTFTNLINAPNFDVNNAGNITVAADEGLDTNGSGALEIGFTNATTVSIGTTAATTLNLGQNGALTRAINIGTGTGVDTISIGTGGTNADVINIGTGFEGTKVSFFPRTANPAFTANGQFAIGQLSGTAGGRIWMRANGRNHRFNSQANVFDYSEYMQQEETSEPGDVMVISDIKRQAVKRSNESYDQNVLGVVTQYGTGYTDAYCEDEVSCDRSRDSNYANVGMLGQVYTKISTENGELRPGDPLATSSIKGVAMKATKAGRILGYALEYFDGTKSGQDVFGHPTYPVHEDSGHKVGKILILLQAGWYDPGAPPIDSIDDIYFNKNYTPPEKKGDYGLVDPSGRVWDNVIAADQAAFANLKAGGLQVQSLDVKDKVNLSELVVQNLTVDLSISNGQLVVKGGSEEVFSVDSFGNAFFKGVITADKIKANQIEGLSLLADEIFTKKLGFQTASQSAQIAGVSTFSDQLTIPGALVVEGESEFKGTTLFQALAEFMSNVIFKGSVEFLSDVTFLGRPIFNNDLAGTAVIAKGEQFVDVVFEKEYASVPIVNISISLDNETLDEKEKTDLEQAILTGDIRYIVTRKTTKGFVIRINKSAPEGLTFSWTALSVKDPKKSQSQGPGDLRYPFDGQYEVTARFGEKLSEAIVQHNEEVGLNGHDGIDFGLPSGTPIYAVDDGEVIPIQDGVETYGQTIVIAHSWGRSFYGHLSEFIATPGQRVKKGDKIALSGNSGLSTGNHLHFGISLNKSNSQNGYLGKVDPLLYLSREVSTVQVEEITPPPSLQPSPTPSPTPTPTPVPTPASPAITITVKDNELGFLRVREGPSTSSNELGQVLPGTTFTVLDGQDGWYKIEFESGKSGWVSGSNVIVN